MYSVRANYLEKRNYIRMKINAPANITLQTDGRTLNGKCRDLSGGGMLIELNTALPLGTKAEITIASNHGHNPILKALAEVNRVIDQPDTDSQPCTLGMHIVEMLN